MTLHCSLSVCIIYIYIYNSCTSHDSYVVTAPNDLMYLYGQFAQTFLLLLCHQFLEVQFTSYIALCTFELSFDLLFAKLTIYANFQYTLLSKWMVDQTPNPSVDGCMQYVY